MHRSEAEGRFGEAEPEGRASVCVKPLCEPSELNQKLAIGNWDWQHFHIGNIHKAQSRVKADWFAVLGQCRHQRVDDRVDRTLGGGHSLLQLADPLIAHKSTQQVFLQHRSGPLPEFHAANRIDTVSNGNNRIKIVKLLHSGNTTRPFDLNL